MAIPLELTPEVITGLFEKFAQTYTNGLSQFFPSIANEIQGPRIVYDVQAFNRGMARHVPRFAPAPLLAPPTRTTVVYEAPTMKAALKPDLVAMLDGRAPGTLNQSNRDKLLGDCVRQIQMFMARRQEWLCAQWLTGGGLLTSAGLNPGGEATGVVYLDYATLAHSSPLPVTLGFSASHLDGVVGASWATATTDIKTDLDIARLACEQDGGVSNANLVFLNSLTMSYLLKNTAFSQAELMKEQIFRTGQVSSLWGYNFFIYDKKYQVDLETMAETTAESDYFIPTNVVIVTTQDNAEAGRAMLECNPSDRNADTGARGVYSWSDEATEHPHEITAGIEWTGGPQLRNPDSTYIYLDVTSTS